MPWVYILKLSNGKYYIGSTTDIDKRVKNHKLGKAKYTAKFLPLRLAFKQEVKTYKLAKEAEIWLKNQKDRDFIEKIIKEGILKKFNSDGKSPGVHRD